jgi:hypothetical protein
MYSSPLSLSNSANMSSTGGDFMVSLPECTPCFDVELCFLLVTASERVLITADSRQV